MEKDEIILRIGSKEVSITHGVFYLGLLTGAVFLAALISWFVSIIAPPAEFPTREIVTIEKGEGLDQVAEHFAQEGFVKSKFWLRTVIILTGAEKEIVAGDYFFNTPESLFTIASRITQGDFGLDPVRITVPEGVTSFAIAEMLEEKLADFDEGVFLRLATSREGYLFPDTYFLPPSITAPEVVALMIENFENKIEEIEEEIDAFGRPLEEVVIMASILEREASDFEDRRKISGVLWNRIEIGMPLQVDAVFPYIIGKNTYELTLTDLEIDSLYNTYKYTGLPEGPIANPGLEALEAAVTPIESDYLYYLADREGNTYYAETFEEHKQNRILHL